MELTVGQKAEKATRLLELEQDIKNRKEQLTANIKEYDKLLMEVRSFIPSIKPGPKPKPPKAPRKPRRARAYANELNPNLDDIAAGIIKTLATDLQ